MSDIPDEFEVIRDELPAEDLEKLRRVKASMDFSERNDIHCTGRPDLIDCPRWPYMLVVLHGQAFAIACIDCIQPVVDATMKAGHGSLRTEGFEDMDVEVVRAFVDQRRAENLKAGEFVIPAPRKGLPR